MRIRSLEDYTAAYRKSVDEPERFWADIADTFIWNQKWDKVLDWNFEDYYAKWFIGAKTNITTNCLDRHLLSQPEKTAIIWEPNDPNEPEIRLSYRQLYEKVCAFSNVLKKHGVKKGDRVVLYMPMVPELAIGVLACARIGAIHSVVFAGFSASALSDRINDAQATVVLSSDGNFRGTKDIAVKAIVDEALQSCPSIQKQIVLKRTGAKVEMQQGRDFWWHQELENLTQTDCEAEIMDSEDPLFILYTSGSTGKPKGVVHHIGGYMVYTKYSFENVFQYNEGDIYWCTADIGWITGHSYIVYGPLLAGATTVMFEGVPTFPDAGRFWQVVEKYKISLFYTAPTAIRALQAQGDAWVKKHDLSSLRVLGSVGEPINEEAWQWYYQNVGKNNCPIVDTWWQTETGGIMISPLAGITPTKPTYATLPLPGVQPVLLDGEGKELKGNGVEGNLCIKFPWPSMIRTTYGDHERCQQTYFGMYKGYYFTGDGCRRDPDGYYRILGRVDDVINVSGHRMGTAEVEDAINQHPAVVESAVVGYPHEIKGQGIYAFVICDGEAVAQSSIEQLRKEILQTVTQHIGAIAKPDKIQIVTGLPKTRSGKIMRRILRKIAEGDTSNLGDTTTLLDPAVVDEIKEGAKEFHTA